MPTSILLTTKIQVTALIDIETPDFLACYRTGLWWSLYGDGKKSYPLPDTYLINNLKQYESKSLFEGKQGKRLSWIGFYFGMIHGSVLSPDTGTLRSDVEMLAILTHQDSRHGYEVGRRDTSMDCTLDQHLYTEKFLLEELRQIALDLVGYPDEINSWFYTIGCVLGAMSLQVFPATAHECTRWQAEYRQWEQEYEEHIARTRDAQSLHTVSIV